MSDSNEDTLETACIECGQPVREVTDSDAEWAWTLVEALSGHAQYCQTCFDAMGRRGENEEDMAMGNSQSQPERSDTATWLLQVCPDCGWTILDEDHVRNAEHPEVGGDCEACLVDGDETCGPCRVLVVGEVTR